MPMPIPTPRALHSRLITLEMDGTYEADFRRVLRDHRMRLGVALRSQDAGHIAERRDEAVDMLEGWRFTPHGVDLDR